MKSCTSIPGFAREEAFASAEEDKTAHTEVRPPEARGMRTKSVSKFASVRLPEGQPPCCPLWRRARRSSSLRSPVAHPISGFGKRWTFALAILAAVFAPVAALAQSLGPATGAAALEPPPYVTLWQVIQSGGWVMIPLGALSFIGTVLVLVYLFTIRRSAVVTEHFMHTAESLLRQGDYAGLAAIANRHSEAVARVVQTTLDFSMRHPEASLSLVREVAETEGTRQASALTQRISYLADVGAIAPMVGLFGTVIGMIQSFSVLASDIAASRPMMLAAGVSVALVTTAAGLIIGIPALAFYAFFRGRVQGLIAELEAASVRVFALLSLQFQKQSAKKRPASSAPAVFEDEL